MSPRAQNPSLKPTSEIPDRLYFKIGEAAQLVGVQCHVLRYWEKEIPLIRPAKSSSNQRRYRRRDVEFFREIQRLLHEERYTLAGARRRLASGRTGAAEPTLPAGHDAPAAPARDPGRTNESAGSPEGLERIRGGLNELIRMAGEEP